VYTVRCISADGKTFTSAYDAAGMAAEEADPIQLALSATATAKKTSQIVLVVDHNLTFWNKDANGIWKKSMDVYCGYGKNGLKQAASRSEGDKTTPIGSFPLTLAFGTGANPGTGMDYRRITKQSYWSAVRDNTYNTWVESATYVSGEHLADYYQYKYAIAIGFNIDPVVYGRGSGIFLHCKSTDHWYTAGCVSVEESDMLRLMCAMNNGAYIIIVPNTASISSY
ncbi:MAG: L,D-transpeptidase family protein, partial [Oscillospiraceae bacterium]|nr:L,D-transpeptidase family protein [Oscillospiraceae bacterium]